ncbi:unnamed protein product, partial [Iphiclides podalirius]
MLDDSRIGTEEKLLEELREFRWEMKSRFKEQSKEYAQLLDRFIRTKSEVQRIKQSMKLVLEKVNKVDLLESKLKTLLMRNEFLENALETEKKKKETKSNEAKSNAVVNCNNRCLDLVLSGLSAYGRVDVRESREPLVPVDVHHPPLDITCRAKVKSMIEIAHKNYLLRVQNVLHKDPTSFWNYTETKRGNRGVQKILKNGEVLNAQHCATEFAHFFHSVYSSHRAELDVSAAIAAAGGENGAARVHVGRLTLDEVRQALKQLKPKKSAGPDGIPPYLFRDCRFALAEPLLYIFNQCL